MIIKKLFTGFIATMLVTSVALAGPGPKAAPKGETIDGYVSEVARSTGKSESEIREEAVEALRKSGKFSREQLERIGRGERIELDAVKHNEAVNLLKASESFRARTGLAAVRNESIRNEANAEFDGMKVERAAAPKVEARAKVEPTRMEKEVLALGRIGELVGNRAMEAVKNVSPEHYAVVKKFSLIVAKRVSKGQIKKDVAEQMVIDIAESPKVLAGKLVIGEGATEACMGMAGEAVENMGDFIRGGALEGRDGETYVKGMGKRAAEKFKQELEEGIARVCALASSGCKLFSSAIVDACKKIGGARAI